MPAPAQMGQGPASTPATAVPGMVPFDQAAHRGYEPGPTTSVQPGSSQVTWGPNPLPATGYLRSIIIEVVGAGGAGAATASGDYPFNLINLVRLQDTNGAPIVELSGWNLMLANVWGGYAASSDPRNDPDYSSSSTNPSFQLRIPIEIAPNGLGALANQSNSQAYRLTVIFDTSAVIWTSAPASTIPTFTVKTFMDYWTLPNAADMLGRPQQQTPPFNGIAQYWTQQPNVALASGSNQVAISRVGNMIRTLIFVTRSSGTRSATPMLDPYTIDWDQRDLQIASLRTLRKQMREMMTNITTLDTGVYALCFSYGEDRNIGANGINSWLATVTATRLLLKGSNSGAGTVDILVNDVSIAEVDPNLRALEVSATGFHPPVAPVVYAAQ